MAPEDTLKQLGQIILGPAIKWNAHCIDHYPISITGHCVLGLRDSFLNVKSKVNLNPFFLGKTPYGWRPIRVFPKGGRQINSLDLRWELVRNANSHAPPRIVCAQKTRGGTHQSVS